MIGFLVLENCSKILPGDCTTSSLIAIQPGIRDISHFTIIPNRFFRGKTVPNSILDESSISIPSFISPSSLSPFLERSIAESLKSSKQRYTQRLSFANVKRRFPDRDRKEGIWFVIGWRYDHTRDPWNCIDRIDNYYISFDVIFALTV